MLYLLIQYLHAYYNTGLFLRCKLSAKGIEIHKMLALRCKSRYWEKGDKIINAKMAKYTTHIVSASSSELVFFSSRCELTRFPQTAQPSNLKFLIKLIIWSVLPLFSILPNMVPIRSRLHHHVPLARISIFITHRCIIVMIHIVQHRNQFAGLGVSKLLVHWVREVDRVGAESVQLAEENCVENRVFARPGSMESVNQMNEWALTIFIESNRCIMGFKIQDIRE